MQILKNFKRYLTIFKQSQLISDVSLTNLTRNQTTCSLKHYQLQTPLLDKVIKSKDLVLLKDLFNKHKFELRIAGGAVRDLLMNIEPHDVDLATDAVPEQMLDIFEREHIRVFNKNGIKHGTITVRIKDRSNFEITTLRIDVECYGRQAEVEFTNDWHADAIRRDLTFNSLFLDFSGKVHDYVGGYEDLQKKVVRFVGIPDKRVKEDYLRILRYFRFFSRVSDNPNDHDKASIQAIRDNASGLASISAERKGDELRKILSQKFSDTFMRMFYDLKIAEYIGLPTNGNVNNYSSVYKEIFHLNPKPMTLVFSLINNSDEIASLQSTLKLSNEEMFLITALSKYVPRILTGDMSNKSDKELLQFFDREFARSKANNGKYLKLQEAIEILKYCQKSHLIERIMNDRKHFKFNITYQSEILRTLALPVPESNNEHVAFDQLMAKKRLRLNHLLYDLKELWIDSNFSKSDEDLVKEMRLHGDLGSYVILPRKKKKNKLI